MAPVLKVTLDTNCIINMLDPSSETATSVDELLAIMRHAMNGRVNIAVTTAIDRDLRRDPLDERREEMLRIVQIFPMVAAAFRIGESLIGGRDVLVSDRQAKLAGEIQAALFPGMTGDDRRRWNKIADVDHLAAHLNADRDVFVTDDRPVLRKRDVLQATFGIEVATPSEVLDRIEKVVDLDLVAADFRRNLARVVAIILSGVNREGEWTYEEHAEFKEKREALLRAYPKMLDDFQSYRVTAASMPAGGGARVLSYMAKKQLQDNLDPFRQFYGPTELSEVLLDMSRRNARLFWDALYRWVQGEAGRADTLLAGFIGYLER